jgi:hypothetical protein
MSEEANLLRLLVQADKEFKITPVRVSETATLFTSQLTSGYKRKELSFYNNSNTSSGEIEWGGSTLAKGNGQPIPVGAIFTVPVAVNLPVYLICGSGEGDVRAIELA